MFPGSIATFFLVSAVLTWSCSAQSVVDPSNTGSDQRTEEVSYKIGATPDQVEVDRTRAKVREFIWYQWQEKCDGRLTLEHYTKEGEKIISTFEVTRTGERCVVLGRITGFYRSRDPQAASGGEFEQVRIFTAENIERIPITKDDRADPISVPEDSVLEHDAYRIRFKDAKGNTVFEL